MLNSVEQFIGVYTIIDYTVLFLIKQQRFCKYSGFGS